MKHTLVAAFATLTDANRTRGDLMARGIPREQIHAVGAESADIHAYDAPYSTSPDVPVDRHEHESKVAHFFKSLFGHEPHEQHRHYATAYPDAVRRGALVIAVDVVDEDQLARARDALEYNGAIDIDEHGGSGTADGYPGPSSPYAGATGGDSHLDKHFTRPTSGTTGATTGAGLHSASERFGDNAGTGAAAEVGAHASTPSAYHDSNTADTGRYDIGSAAKRAGTDYPETTATSHPTGAGITGHGSNSDAPEIAPGVGTREAGLCRDRICVIQRPS
ncbi:MULTISPECIES: hypothetical protein [Stutzerimonas]|mgnify:CR=1 FL=1|jgi:hypothetical protein|uniref:hypothetical protein n=1 Tax=Stutzerimonas TaxID=2901164 RepID=UPI0003122EA4|nr:MULTISPECIES: hypothetical protein [Stutzerimonas]RCL58188.1 MAG: hypothetical protein DBW88_10465 [Pseudomonas sp.]AKN29218.1 hypothetical protein AB691_4366 [Stutzerimonas stutzeri]AVX15116.1 hypothetical protein CXB48_21150 [Stutzerimonas stutzeri]KXO74626.1 hypothetical protein AYK87_19730 [Stutzerimonas stutzeri]MBD9412191.1 hypothetical protein [Stutzerimonas stutzeri]